MTTADDHAREVRRAEAIDLRVQGFSYREIGKRLNVSAQTAYNDVQAELSEVREEAAENAKQNLRLDLQRIDIAIQLAIKKVQEGELAAIDRLVKLTDQRAKLLRLYEPESRGDSSPIVNVNVVPLELPAIPSDDDE
jgi:cell fate regulator YaaT (PSP1 superfamily)